jgi:hypothetical protein
MKKKIKIICVISIFIFGCKNKNDGVNSVEYYNVPNISHTIKDSIINKIELTPLSIDSNIESSNVGYFWVSRDTLYFSDTHFGYVFSFNENGRMVNKYLGKGKGPNEIIGIESSIPTDKGFSIFYGGNNSLHSYDKKWNREKTGRIKWGFKRKMKEVMKNPEPTLPESYEFDSGYENIIKQWDKNHVSIALTASHPKFNGYFDTDLYYNYSRILALVNIETGKIDQFIGRRSPFYLTKLNLPIFDHFNYEPYDDNVFLNFWPDKDIYILDKKTGLATGKFGIKGKGMNVDYPVTTSYKEATQKHMEHRKRYDYYRQLKYISERKLLFRSYTKKGIMDHDGLQIYYKNALIGDLLVPKRFEIIGNIGKEIIGVVSNNDEGFKVYKVKLEYEN